MIGLHELGHFMFAKRAGMKVSEFFIGFGPRLWSVQRGETEYGVKALPLGGYCKIVGMTNLEDVDPGDEPRTFRAKGFWAKTSTLLAGPGSHFVLAVLLMGSVLAFAGDFHEAKPQPVVAHVEQSIDRVDPQGHTTSLRTPAAQSGLQEGDRIRAINSKASTSWAQAQDAIKADGGHDIAIAVARAGRALTLHTRVLADGPAGNGVGYLGISPDVKVPRPSVLGAIRLAPVRTAQVLGATVQGFGHIFSPSGI